MATNEKARKKAKIIKHLQKHGNKTKACEFAGVPKRTLYFWCSEDAIFLKNTGLAMAAFYSK